MRAISLALVATILCTLSSALPADLPDTVLKVGDHPDNEVFTKRDAIPNPKAPLIARQSRAGLRSLSRLGVVRSTVVMASTTTASPTAIATVSSKATVATTTTVRATSTTAAAAPVSTLGSDIRAAVLAEHNTFRAQHAAPPLVWNQTLADLAASWANRCVFQHSQGALGRYGENLAASAGSGVTVQTALNGIKAWEAEASDYTPATPNYSHFTQMVWKSTTQLGCYQASCPAGSIFDARYGVNSYLVCEYDPPGNVYPASNFQANVTP